jgi:hypothetical protein
MKWINFFALLALVVSTAHGAAPDVNGSWKWKFERNNGESTDILMTLKQEGAKISGNIKAADREMKVENAKLTSEGQLTFFINIERDNGPLKIEFDGKVQGDKITGKTLYAGGDGEKREREWIATREKARDVSGKWNSVFKRQDGNPMETTLQLKQSGDKITGSQSFNDNESEISDGKVTGNDVTFKIVRERDGRTVTSKYRGKIQSDNTIKGEIESDWTGEVRKLEWEATKAR